MEVFTSHLDWSGAAAGPTRDAATFSRDLTASVGDHWLPMSSAPGYRGDPSRVNPEQLFVTSVSACQALTYLFLAAKHRVTVIGYRDDAEGELGVVDGKMRMSRVTLRPLITLDAGADEARARELVHKAHASCFIANSVATPVEIEPVFAVAAAAGERRAPSVSAIALAGLMAAAAGLAAAAPQVKPPAGATIDTVAVEGTIDVVSPRTQSLSVKTTDGTTQLFRLLEKVFVHGRTGTDDELSGLKPGTTVVVHYSGTGSSATVQEVDRIDSDGLEISEGYVTSIDRVRGEIKIRFDDKRTETLKLSNRVSRNVGRNTAANTRVVVYYTNHKGVKEVHYFKKKT